MTKYPIPNFRTIKIVNKMKWNKNVYPKFLLAFINGVWMLLFPPCLVNFIPFYGMCVSVVNIFDIVYPVPKWNDLSEYIYRLVFYLHLCALLQIRNWNRNLFFFSSVCLDASTLLEAWIKIQREICF